MVTLTVSGISKQEGKGIVLKETSFSREGFRKIAIAGETGSGKSTLLKIIGGLTQPETGEVFFEKEKVWGPNYKLIPGHPGIAYLSQHFELLNNYRVEDLLLFDNILPVKEAEAIFAICRIDHLLQRRTDQLSGGEKQRIALAKLLVTAPRLLLLDEPFSNLDIIHKNILKTVIHYIGERLNISCIMISHDPVDTLSWAEEILVMKAGQIVQQGTPEQVYRQPVNEYVAGLFGRYNLVNATDAGILSGTSYEVPDEKSIFLRPEQLNIVPVKEGILEGKINRILFFGSHYETEVVYPGNTLIIKTAIGNLAKGETVGLTLTPGEVWYI